MTFMKTIVSFQQLLSSKVFAHLCDIVDDDGTRFTKELQQISKQIILEGKFDNCNDS